MCQIAAYIGPQPAAPLLLTSLSLQEPYLGGQATGIATLHDRGILIAKSRGHVSAAGKRQDLDLPGTLGMAHSRYNTAAATDHALNVDVCAHPWRGEDGRLALMHNGEVANHRPLYETLSSHHTFQSYLPERNRVVDSEVALHLVEDLVRERPLGSAIGEMAARIRGRFLFAILDREAPDSIWIANWLQPCYIGMGAGETMMASSRIGLRPLEASFHTVFQPPKNSLIQLKSTGVTITPLDTARRTPDLAPNRFRMGDRILGHLADGQEHDTAWLYDQVIETRTADLYDLPDTWDPLLIEGWGEANHITDTLAMLVEQGKVSIRLGVVDEGGHQQVPRYLYRRIGR